MKIKKTNAKLFLFPLLSLFFLNRIINSCSERKDQFISSEFTSVDTIIQNAIQDSVFPGAVLFIGNDHGVHYKKAYRCTDYAENAWATKTITLFDLASLTKVIATTSVIMKLYEKRKLDLSWH